MILKFTHLLKILWRSRCRLTLNLKNQIYLYSTTLDHRMFGMLHFIIHNSSLSLGTAERWDSRAQGRLLSRAHSSYLEIYNMKLSIDSYVICPVRPRSYVVTTQLQPNNHAGCKKSETILLVTPPKKSKFFLPYGYP